MRFRADPQRLRGSIAALVTPFDRGGDLDLDSLRRLTRWQIAEGSHGVSIGGSTSEPTAQTLAERARAIRTVAEVVDDRVPLLAGTGCARLEDTLALTGHAADAGADAVLVVTPYYAKPTQEGLREWYSVVCREFPDLPVIAYNVPTRTAVDLAPATVAALHRDLDNFVGIKETTADFGHFSDVLRHAGPDLLVWSGLEALCLPLLAIGGVGFITATANLAPRASADLYAAWADGDRERARSLHFALQPLVDLLFVETNPAPAKYAMQHRGVISSGHVRPPLTEPRPESVTRIHDLLDQGRDWLSPAPADAPEPGRDATPEGISGALPGHGATTGSHR